MKYKVLDGASKCTKCRLGFTFGALVIDSRRVDPILTCLVALEKN